MSGLKYIVWTMACAVAGLGAERGPSLRIQIPSVMPRDQQLGEYSPRLVLSHANLSAEPHTAKCWLLEEDGWNCASTQFCEQTFAVNGGRDGSVEIASPMDVYDYGPNLTFVVRLYNSAGLEVAMAKARTRTVEARPPCLNPIGKRVGMVGQPLRFVVSSHAGSASGEKVVFRVHNAPVESRLDSETGVFTWTPSEAGLFRMTVEAVSESSKLTDAEIVSLDIAQAEEASAAVPQPVPDPH